MEPRAVENLAKIQAEDGELMRTKNFSGSS
jgi:hypothetical protein